MKLTGRTIKITAVILVASILLSATATAASFEDFGDAQGHWAEDYLRRAVREGLLTGTTPTTLEPGVPANLPQALTILCRLLEPETAADFH